MSQALVSVITIFLDEERFLAEAIESVEAQDYTNWELLLVDDGSQDDSATITRSYAERDRRIRYLAHDGGANLGMSASRNLALRQARGDYIALLDADDVWYPDTLRLEVALLERHPEVALGCGTALWWGSWDGDGGDSCDLVAVLAPVRDAPIDPPDFVSTIVRDGAAVPCPCTVIVRTDCLRAVGGFEEAFRDLYEDQVLFAKIGLEWPVAVTTECLGKYRQHEDQCCVRAAKEGTVGESHARYLTWLATYARSREIDDPTFWSDLGRAQAAYGLQPA